MNIIALGSNFQPCLALAELFAWDKLWGSSVQRVFTSLVCPAWWGSGNRFWWRGCLWKGWKKTSGKSICWCASTGGPLLQTTHHRARTPHQTNWQSHSQKGIAVWPTAGWTEEGRSEKERVAISKLILVPSPMLSMWYSKKQPCSYCPCVGRLQTYRLR